MQANFDISYKTYQKITAKNSSAEVITEEEMLLAQLSGMNSQSSANFAYAN